MGNILDQKPNRYSSVQGTSQVMAGNYMQTYHQRPNVPGDSTDSVSWGDKGSNMQIGAKLILDNSTNELYIVNRQNQKVYVTENGVAKPNAAAIVRSAKNWGRGPLVQFSGTPLHPKVYVYSGTDEQKGTYFQPHEINSMADFKHYLTIGNEGMGVSGKYSGYYGQASVSGPFNKMGKDIYSWGADINRAVDAVTKAAAVPLIFEGIGNFVPGFSTAMQVTGVTDEVQKGFVNLMDGIAKRNRYAGSSNYDLSLSNALKDPRLKTDYSRIQQQNTATGKQFNVPSTPGSKATLAMPENTPQQIIEKARAIEGETDEIVIKTQTHELLKSIVLLKRAMPNYDFSYIDQMQSGLRASTNYSSSINIITHFAKRIQSNVLPEYLKLQQNQPASPQKDEPVPPKGGSLGPLPYHPWVINGNSWGHSEQVVIKG